MSRSFRLLVGALVSLSAAPAFAQFSFPTLLLCPEPTLTRCQDPNFLKGRCGGSRCTTVLRNEYSARHDAVPIQETAVVPDNLYDHGINVSAKTQAYDYARHYHTGSYGIFAGNMSRTQLSVLKNTGWFAITPHATWRNNGSRVNSCEELVYDRFRSFSEWEDNVAGLGNRYLDVVSEALNTLGWQPMRDAAGRNLGNFPFRTLPRNAYFTPLDTRVPVGTAASTLDGYWKPIVAAAPQRRWSWDEHVAGLFGTLGYYSEDLLEKEYVDQKKYLEYLRARADVFAEYERSFRDCAAAHGASSSTCRAIANNYGSQLNSIDFGIAVILFQARQRGCLDTHRWTQCDWSPQFMVEQLKADVNVDREHQLNQCILVSRNDFNSGIVGQARSPSGFWSGGRQVIVSDDWNSDPGKMIVLFALIQNYARGLDVPRDPATGKPTTAKMSSDSGALGNDLFGVTYDYSAGWGFTGFEQALCNSNLHGKASFKAVGKVLGMDTELIDALAEVTTAPKGDANSDYVAFIARRKLEVLEADIVVGPDVDQVELTVQPAINLALEYSVQTDDSTPPAFHTIVVVLGVPVTVKGGVAGSVGVEARLTGGLSRHCSTNANSIGFQMTGTMKPFAGIDAWSTASVDAGILEVGIKGRLTVIELNLPLQVSVAAEVNPANNWALELRARSSLKLGLETLSGQISIFARLFWKNFNRDLVKWTGPNVETALWDWNYDPAVSLDALRLAVSTGF